MCVDRCDLTDRKRRSEKSGFRLGVVGDMDGGSSASQASHVAIEPTAMRNGKAMKRDGREMEDRERERERESRTLRCVGRRRISRA